MSLSCTGSLARNEPEKIERTTEVYRYTSVHIGRCEQWSIRNRSGNAKEVIALQIHILSSFFESLLTGSSWPSSLTDLSRDCHERLTDPGLKITAWAWAPVEEVTEYSSQSTYTITTATYRIQFMMSVVKIVLPFDQSEHQGGVDAALLKAVWFWSPTERTIKKYASSPLKRLDAHCVVLFGMSYGLSVDHWMH